MEFTKQLCLSKEYLNMKLSSIVYVYQIPLRKPKSTIGNADLTTLKVKLKK